MARPWDARAIELEPTQGPYADYAAFLEWFNRQEEAVGLDSEQMDCVLDAAQMITLYAMFSHAFDGEHAADVPVVVEVPKVTAEPSANVLPCGCTVTAGYRCPMCDGP